MRILLLYIILLSGIGLAQNYVVNPVNTKFRGDVFSPAFLDSSVIVCSNQKDRIHKTVVDESGSETVNLYSFDPATNLSDRFDPLFRTIYNDGPIAFNRKGNIAVVSRNMKTDQKSKALMKEENPLGLYLSVRTDIGWTIPELIPFCKPEYHYTHPTLNAIGTRLIFASDLTGGEGGYDLWSSELVDGKWQDPVNLGPEINSEKNELFPTINGTVLSFSVNKNEVGGLDIYQCELESKFIELNLMPEPINSADDDFGLISNTQFQNGYFSSNRNGLDELMSFNLEFPIFTSCDSLVENIMCYTLYEENAVIYGQEAIGALAYEWSINDVKLRGIEVDYCFPGPGDYNISLDIIDTILNKTYFQQASYQISLEMEEQPYISCPDTVKPGDEFILSAKESYLPFMIVENYYWDFGDGLKAMGMEVEHTYQKPGIYYIQLGVNGFEEEARSSDCSWKKIVCHGEGDLVDDQSIAKLFPNMVYNTSNGKSKNKGDEVDSTAIKLYTIEALTSFNRLDSTGFEFKLLQKFNAQEVYDVNTNLYSYRVGRYEEFKDAYNKWIELQELGFESAVLKTLIIEMQDPSIKLSETFILENVTFEQGSWELTPESESELGKIYTLMFELPDLSVYITAHTSNEGSEDLNDKLSRKRADSVKKWLVSMGIDAKRITTKGFGELKPIATNDTEEGREKNRRVEFTFTRNK